MDLINYLLVFIIFISLFAFLRFNNLLLDDTSFSNHKIYGIENKSPVILGGIFFLFIFLIFDQNFTLNIKISLIAVTVLGLMSDRNIMPNPTLRFLIQLIILFQLVYFEGLRVDDLKNHFLNELLTNYFFNIFFTVFCLAILMNGSNFLDGLNGLLSGYYLIAISLMFFYGDYNKNIIVDYNFLSLMTWALTIFFIFNIFGIVYLGDSGSYLTSMLIGIYLIKFNTLNYLVSPYYIASILWYPAFENFFSLVRRLYQKKRVSFADKLHLHQLIFLYIQSKNFIKPKFLNSFSGIILIILFLPGLFFSNLYISHSLILIGIISFNILFYLGIYLFLFNKLVNKE